ncbi:MAG: hypothetical protein GY870_12565 [archaeon]|nr:hypothetical protein [archaeon]
MNTKYNLFIGRYDPFHKGHKYIIDSFIDNSKHVCIAVRDCESNTSTEERVLAIKSVYKNNPMVKVITIPDIEQVCIGREVGYSIVEVPEDIKIISATKIRKGILNNDEMETKNF